VIADFPGPEPGTDAEATYPVQAIARMVAAAHRAGARVAVHSTVPDTGQLVAVGVDSVEHGWSGLDEHAIRDMAGRGTALAPTVGALVAMLDAPGTAPGRRRGFAEGQARVAELLPLAVRLGVPVLAGTDVTGRWRYWRGWAWNPKRRWPRPASGRASSSAPRPPPISSPTTTTPRGPRPAGPSGRRRGRRNTAALMRA
jgi:hypothetical protein